MAEIYLNTIPVRTWNWLGVRNANLNGPFPVIIPYQKQPLAQELPAGVTITNVPGKRETGDNISKTGSAWLAANSNSGYTITIDAGCKVAEPIVICYELDDDNPTLVDHSCIMAGEGSEATIVFHYYSRQAANGFHGGLTRVEAQTGATVNVVKVQTLSDDIVHVDTMEVVAATGGTVNVVLAELGASQSITSCHTELAGEASNGNLYSIYMGDQDRKLDINYVVTHKGKQSVSAIESRGVLLDSSQKIFRDTLDFRQGSVGAKGREEEYTVLLSPSVRNRSVPLILCGEADVEGQHAASSGNLDDGKLFYLMSRGFSEIEAKKQIIEASFQPITAKIPVPQLQQTITEYVRRRLDRVE